MPSRDLAKRREYSRRWYEKNKERKKKYREEHRDKILAYQKEWYKQNGEHHIAKVTARKWNQYSGRCVVCGAVTMGESKAKPGSRFCRNHRKEQWQEKTGKS